MGRDKPHPAGKKRAASMKKKSKLVITFDADKRKEYLTGFSKRKQERRRFGLDMEAFKQKKKLLEARKQRREEQKQLYASLNIDQEEDEAEEEEEEEEEDDDEDDNGEGSLQKETQVLTFDDEHTQSKFGDVVTVTTSVAGFKSDSDEDEYSDLDGGAEEVKSAQAGKRKGTDSNEKQLTLFQRIQLKRKGLALPTKRSKLKMVRESRKGLAAAGKQLGRKGGPKRDDDGDRKSSKASSVGKGKAKSTGKGMKKQVNKRRKH